MSGTYAAVLAGGTGARFGGATPKQFTLIGDRIMLDFSLQAYSSAKGIDGVVVVAEERFHERIRALVEERGYPKIIGVIPGGATRTDSSWAVLNWLSSSDRSVKAVLLHDAARPFVSLDVIERMVATLNSYSAATAVIEVVDTVCTVGSEREDAQVITGTLDRSVLRAVQTPQGFLFDKLKSAFEIYRRERPREFSDDIGLFQHYYPEELVAAVPGNPENFKVTTPIDRIFAEEVARCRLEGESPHGSLREEPSTLGGRTDGASLSRTPYRA